MHARLLGLEQAESSFYTCCLMQPRQSLSSGQWDLQE